MKIDRDKFTVTVEIPDVKRDSHYGVLVCHNDCPLRVHFYEDYMSCVLDLSVEIEGTQYGIKPGPDCPRHQG
jgi:hypothetical protein